MSYFMKIYYSDRMTEVDFMDKSTVQIGFNTNNDVIISEFNPQQQISASQTENGVHITSNMTIEVSGQQTTNTCITPKDTCFLSRSPLTAVSVYKKGKDSTKTIDLKKVPFVTIGRNLENTVCLRNNRVSQPHATIISKQGQYVLTDDKPSTNGTYLNNKRIRNAYLKDGDVISIVNYRIIFNNGMLFFRNVGSDLHLNIETSYDPLPEKEYPYFAKPQREREELPSERTEVPEEITIQTSATYTEHAGINATQMLASAGASIGMSLFMGPMALMGLLGPATSGITSKIGKRKREKARAEYVEIYKKYLEEQKVKLSVAACQQRRIMNHEHPTASMCFEIAREVQDRLWERTIWDDDFMSLRLGVGEQASVTQVKCDDIERNAMMQDELILAPGEIKKEFAMVKDTPVRTSFKENPTIGVVGDRPTALQIAKNMIVQATTHHSYDELKIVTIFAENEEKEWGWMRWLPHSWNDTKTRRFMASSRREVSALCKDIEEILKQRNRELREDEYRNEEVKLPYFLFVLTNKSLIEDETILRYIAKNNSKMSIGTIMLFDNKANMPSMNKIMIASVKHGAGELYCTDSANNKTAFVPDRITNEELDAFARSLAPVRLKTMTEEGKLPNCVTFLQGYNAKKAEDIDIAAYWGKSCVYKSLAVPVGVKSNGDPFYFDIHDSDSYNPKGHGTNGQIQGMPGSGKSEMILTWILSLALHFPPSFVSFVLVDFKGTGLLLPFENLPHLAGAISNIDTSIGRKLVALNNEMKRREELFNTYGVKSMNSYLEKFYRGEIDEPLAAMIVVVDEFAEFKKQFPDSMSSIDTMFAKGRSLGVFPIMASQNMSGAAVGNMASNTHFKWCFQVASAANSREFIGDPGASKISNAGRGYVKVGDDGFLELIQSYWSGAPYNPAAETQVRTSVRISTVELDGSREKCEDYDKTVGFKSNDSEIDAIVKHISNFVEENDIPKARAVWTEELGEKIPLESLSKKDIGFNGEIWQSSDGDLAPIIGLIDNPIEQSQYPLELNLSKNGHVAIYGAPGTGKTTLLQTLIMSLARTYTPDDVNIYIMDFGGWSLSRFKELPHVGGAANDNEKEKIEKLTKFLSDELEERRRKFSGEGVQNISLYRQITGEMLPEIVLILDNFMPVNDLYPDLSNFFVTFTQQGGSYGMYFVVSTGAVGSLGYKTGQNIKTNIALQMTDRSDYVSIVGKTNGLEPGNVDGRGLVKGEKPLEFQTALPTDAHGSDMTGKLGELCALMNEKWTGERAKPIPIMAETIPFNSMKVIGRKLPIGLLTADMTPAYIDLDESHYYLISGTESSGKSNLLKAIVKNFQTFEGTEITVYDSSRLGLDSLKETVSNYITEAPAFGEYIESLMLVLRERKEQYGQDKSVQFSPIVIVIDDLHESLTDGATEEITVKQLEAFCRLGKGLNVNIFVAGQHEEVARLSLGEIFTLGVVKNGINILLGGKFTTHSIYDSTLSYSEKDAKLGEYEGYLLKQGNAERFKAIKVD